MWGRSGRNSSTPTCTEQMVPITVTELGRGFVIGRERVVSKVNKTFTAPGGQRGSIVYVYESGMLVSKDSKGAVVSLELKDGPDTRADRQVAIIVWTTDNESAA